MDARSLTVSDGSIEAQAATRAQGFTRDSWIFLSLAVSITALRTYSRWSMVGLRRFQADDFLVWLALGLYAGETIIDTKLLGEFRGLANDFTDDAERAALGPDSEEYKLRVGASQFRLAEWPMYAMLLWSLKAAMAVFYLRLTESLAGYRARIYIFFALMATTFVTVCAVPFITCNPVSKMWQINPDPGPLCYPESSPAILGTILGCNIVTDAYLLWLPMPMLSQASLPRSTKAVLVCLFGCGLFVTVAATLRIALVAYEVHDFHDIGFWSVRETFVAIVTTNVPAIFVLARRWLRPWPPSPPPPTRGAAGGAWTGTDSDSSSSSRLRKGAGSSHAGRTRPVYGSGSGGALVGYASSSGRRPPAPPARLPWRARPSPPRRNGAGARGAGGRWNGRSNGDNNLDGMRKQIDIVIGPSPPEASRSGGMLLDVERDAGPKPLPTCRLPGHVYRW